MSGSERSYRRGELRKKEDLRDKFMFAVAQNNIKVESWLPDNREYPTAPQNQNSQPFFELPVIESGTGIGSSYDKNRKIKNLLQFGDRNHIMKSYNVGRSRTHASKSLHSLVNRIRDNSRKSSNNSLNHPQQKFQFPERGSLHENKDDEESEEENITESRTVKRGTNLLFDTKTKVSKSHK